MNESEQEAGGGWKWLFIHEWIGYESVCAIHKFIRTWVYTFSFSIFLLRVICNSRCLRAFKRARRKKPLRSANANVYKCYCRVAECFVLNEITIFMNGFLILRDNPATHSRFTMYIHLIKFETKTNATQSAAKCERKSRFWRDQIKEQHHPQVMYVFDVDVDLWLVWNEKKVALFFLIIISEHVCYEFRRISCLNRVNCVICIFDNRKPKSIKQTAGRLATGQPIKWKKKQQPWMLIARERMNQRQIANRRFNNIRTHTHNVCKLKSDFQKIYSKRINSNVLQLNG